MEPQISSVGIALSVFLTSHTEKLRTIIKKSNIKFNSSELIGLVYHSLLEGKGARHK